MSTRSCSSSRADAGRRARLRRVVAGGVLPVLLAGSLAACSFEGMDLVAGSDEGVTTTQESGEQNTATPTPEPVPDVRLRLEALGPKDAVKVHSTVRVHAEHGTLRQVRVTTSEGELEGELTAEGWVARERLEPGRAYTVHAVAVREDGSRQRVTTTFHSQDLTLDQQTYPAIAPLDGETVGVGMPVVVQFDIPVSNRARIERHMSVTSTPETTGSWHWISDSIVRWRPKEFWEPGTNVTVHVNINSVKAGPNLWGQMNRTISFTIGEKHIYRANLDTHQMKVYVSGELVRTLPFSAGDPDKGYATRSGIKVIMSKHRYYDMNSASIGIDPDSAEGYDLENVEYAMRLTHSGEFIHAAPWSVWAHGEQNVSHGCTGLSTSRAGWLYELSRRGDVVIFTGSNREMSISNGYGGWNAPSFEAYANGSALH